MGAEERIPTALRWLRQCKQEHPCCKALHRDKQKVALLARILHVGCSQGADQITLCKPSKSNKGFKYLALSHCWGKEGVNITTTKQNISLHQSGIRISFLSRTFRDAVTITRLLGYEYLWIDSLCIIQDDVEDWQKEAAKMSSIFQFADIVLSAASAMNATKGLGINSSFEPALALKITSTDIRRNESQSEKWHMRNMYTNNLLVSIALSPIGARGWIFQELLLAQRVLYIYKGESVWQCHCLIETEYCGVSSTSNISLEPDIRGRTRACSAPIYDFNTLSRGGKSMHEWWRLMDDFLSRDFTKAEDTIPALAGLIDLWQTSTGDTSALGLWQNDLPIHMCWFSDVQLSVSNRMSGYPSWCWTSVRPGAFGRARIKHITQSKSSTPFTPSDIIWKAPVTSVNIDWEGQPFVSRLKRARLSVSRQRVKNGAFHQTIFYALDMEEQDSGFHGEGLEELLPLFITKPNGRRELGGDLFHMHTMLIERVNWPDGTFNYIRKGYADFVSSPDWRQIDMDTKVQEILDGIEDVDMVHLA